MTEDRATGGRAFIRLRVYNVDPATGREQEKLRTATGFDRATAALEPAPMVWPPCQCPHCRAVR